MNYDMWSFYKQEIIDVRQVADLDIDLATRELWSVRLW